MLGFAGIPESIMNVTAMTALAGFWLGYFLLHSWLAGSEPKRWVREHFPGLYVRYRLFYNTIALLLLVPPGLIHVFEPGSVLWSWTGIGAWIANVSGLVALAVVGLAPTGYDLRRFIGLAGVDVDGGLSAEGLRLSGIHRYVRHPWYCAALVLIWTRDMNAAMLISAVMMTGYFVIGSRLEENRLIDDYGDAYRHYRSQVPGLFPLPWRTLDRETAHRLERESAADIARASRHV